MDIKLRPIHYASVSGGKDSLYMLLTILKNPQKYPLDMVVHFELDNDWASAKKVIEEMERMCKKINIKFVRIRPRKTWEELCNRYGFPNARARWCNNVYKLDCKKQLNEWIKSQNCKPVAYIGFCADENKRFKYTIGEWEKEECCYPLAEEGINESEILEWAKEHELLKGYYSLFKRQGCMACPMATMKEWAYLLYTDPEKYEYYLEKIRETEKMVKEKGRKWIFLKMGADEFDRRIKGKWLTKLKNEIERSETK